MNNSLMDIINNRMAEEQITVSDFCKEMKIDENIYYSWVNDPDSITLSNLRKIIDCLHFSDHDIRQILC